jgi:glycosyltransferase involved in cell wall biosynthesis
MISVLTITYQRYTLLEEAIESFLKQSEYFEMVVVNDSPKVEYVYDHSRVKIINCKERFPSIAAKLEWGYKQCTHNYIYRLDDDDLIGPEGLELMAKSIIENPGHEIYRSNAHYFFVDNNYQTTNDNINKDFFAKESLAISPNIDLVNAIISAFIMSNNILTKRDITLETNSTM